MLTRLGLLLLASDPPSDNPPASLAPLDRLTAWIEAHLDQPLSLSDLEQQAECSRRTLQYQFRRRFGCTPMQWVRRQRLNKALRLLQTTEAQHTIAAVARRCGYSNLSAFSRDFKALHHKRPSEVLRHQRQQERS